MKDCAKDLGVLALMAATMAKHAGLAGMRPSTGNVPLLFDADPEQKRLMAKKGWLDRAKEAKTREELETLEKEISEAGSGVSDQTLRKFRRILRDWEHHQLLQSIIIKKAAV